MLKKLIIFFCKTLRINLEDNKLLRQQGVAESIHGTVLFPFTPLRKGIQVSITQYIVKYCQIKLFGLIICET